VAPCTTHGLHGRFSRRSLRRYLARVLRARDAGLSLPVVLELELHRLRAGVRVKARDEALRALKVYPEELDPKTYLHSRRVKRWELELADALERNARRAAAVAAGPSIAMGGGGGMPTVRSTTFAVRASVLLCSVIPHWVSALTRSRGLVRLNGSMGHWVLECQRRSQPTRA
jgi:hypothetical protein